MEKENIKNYVPYRTHGHMPYEIRVVVAGDTAISTI